MLLQHVRTVTPPIKLSAPASVPADEVESVISETAVEVEAIRDDGEQRLLNPGKDKPLINPPLAFQAQRNRLVPSSPALAFCFPVRPLHRDLRV